MNVQQLYYLHLLAGSGARVEVEIEGTVAEGTWVVAKDEFLVSIPEEQATPAGETPGEDTQSPAPSPPKVVRAQLRVFLGTGIHSFGARLKRAEGSLWKVLPTSHVSVSQKRRAVRFPAEVELTYQTAEGEGQGRTRDISLGGVGFCSEGEIPVGARVEITFGEEPWAGLGVVQGTIAWRDRQDKGWSYGLRFEELSRGQRRLLIHLLVRKTQKV